MIYLHFQFSQLKNADTQSFLLPFTFSITLLSFFDTCKLWYYLVIYDMARIYVIRWAFTFPCLTKFQKTKSYQGAFKCDDLNLGLAEAIEILKATGQKFGKQDCFWNIENSLYYFTMFLMDCTWVELLLPYKDPFRPQCHLSLNLFFNSSVIFHVKILTNVSFIFPLLKCFIGFPIFWFWIFGF